jgi:hypothetical protein
MRLSRLCVLPFAMLALAACSQDDGVSVNARPPLGGVRFINAVPDGGPVDIRYVDQVQWSGSSVNGTNIGLAFRAGTAHWATEAKARHIKVFPTDSSLAVTTVAILDTTITIEANKNVTLMLIGSRAAGGKVSFMLIDDTAPTLNGTQIGIRTVNAASTADVPSTATAYILQDTTAALTGTATFPTVPARTASAYVVRDTGSFAIRAIAAGTPATIWSAIAPAGAVADNLIAPTAGYLGSGSAMSAYIFPRSVAGTAAPQTAAFTRPAVVFFVDHLPTPP